MQILMPLIALLYCACFQWAYVKWISPAWGYMGLTYSPPDPSLLAIASAQAALLCLLSPLQLRRTSQLAYWILYFTVYIPGMLTPLFTQLVTGDKLLFLSLSLTGGMLLIALSYRVKLISIGSLSITRELFWKIFILVYVISTVSLLIVFRNTLHFASLEEVYDVRFASGAVGKENPVISYVGTLLCNVMNPFLIAYGLTARRRTLIVIGILGQIIFYATGASKAALLSPLFIMGTYFALRKDRGGLVPVFGLLCCAAFILLTLAVGTRTTGLFFALASVILVRSFAIPGVEMGQYQFFFERFPHTYFGHVHGVSALIPNPYSMALGQEVGYFFGGAADNGRIDNANVAFFAMDGIAGFGLPGILVMGILCALMFWVLDSVSRKYSVTFSASVLTSCVIDLSNNSLFSSFLGGGIMLFMLLFLIMPRDFAGENKVVNS